MRVDLTHTGWVYTRWDWATKVILHLKYCAECNTGLRRVCYCYSRKIAKSDWGLSRILTAQTSDWWRNVIFVWLDKIYVVRILQFLECTTCWNKTSLTIHQCTLSHDVMLWSVLYPALIVSIIMSCLYIASDMNCVGFCMLSYKDSTLRY